VQAREAYRIASVRYNAGSQDLLTLLDSQRTQLQAEDSRIQAGLARLTATVGLYKALGGGWASGA
ncbi:MAG: TolC family protein, partial [Noviherbaspirillum sp.]